MTARQKSVLAALIGVAAVVRGCGIAFGLPLVQARPDEIITINVGIGFLQGQWWPDFFDYPRLLAYVDSLLFAGYGGVAHAARWFASFSDFLSTWKQYWPPLFLLSRIFVASTGTATVLVVYRLGRRVGGHAVGLLAAFFLALAFVHVRDSHYATTDVPMTLLAWTAIALTLAAYDDRSRARLRTAAVVSALAMSTKYSAALLAVPLTVAVLLWWRDGRLKFSEAARELVLLAGIMAGLFLALNPYFLFDYLRVSAALGLLHESYWVGMKTAEPLGPGWVYHLRVSLLYGVGLPLLIVGLAGIVYGAYAQPRRMLIIAAFPVAYYLAAGNSQLVFVRYVLPLVPFLCVTAAMLVSDAARVVRPRARSLAAAAAAALVIAPSARSVVLFDRLMQRADTRLLASEWMRANIPPGARIAQSGSVYGRVGFWPGSQYRLWSMDPFTGTFIEGRRTPVDGLPDVIIVQESPLPYSYVLPRMSVMLGEHYRLVQRFRAYEIANPRNVYDLQDAFFLPYAGFKDVKRPGPNLYIYLPAR